MGTHVSTYARTRVCVCTCVSICVCMHLLGNVDVLQGEECPEAVDGLQPFRLLLHLTHLR